MFVVVGEKFFSLMPCEEEAKQRQTVARAVSVEQEGGRRKVTKKHFPQLFFSDGITSGYIIRTHDTFNKTIYMRVERGGAARRKTRKIRD
jgi:hypothetical protein